MLIGSYHLSAQLLAKVTESLNEQLNWLTFIESCSVGMTPDLRHGLDELLKINWKIRSLLNKSIKVR